MFSNWIAQDNFSNYMMKLQKELKKNNTKEMKCDSCSFCCHARPGNLNKEDVENLAKHFNMTKKEVFQKYLAVDEIIRGILCLLPIRTSQENIAGSFMPSRNTFDTDPCIFLKDKKCELHDIAKPVVCRETLCKNEEGCNIPSWTREDLKELGWDGYEEDF